MTLPPNEKRAPVYSYLLFSFCLLLIAWCANPAKLYFLNDDFIHIPMAYDGTVGHHNGIRYVNDFSLYIDSLFWKENATGYHLTNLLLYIANLLLAIPLLHKLTTTLGFPISARLIVVIVSLFGVYAFHSEALFWILCRTATLSFFFNLLSWHCFFLSLKQRWWMVPMILFFLLGIFTYESLWVFPVWLLFWYWLSPQIVAMPAKKGLDQTNSEISKRSTLLPIGVIWLFFTFYFPYRRMKQGELLGTYEANDIQESHWLSIVGKSARLFARSFLPPVNGPVYFATFTVFALSLVAAFAFFILKKKRGNRLLLFLVLAWMVSYAPYIALGISTNGYESERYLYYPSFFLCAAFVYAVVLFWKKQPLVQNIVLALAFIYHCSFFIKSGIVFQKVSSYSRLGIEAIQKIPPGKKLVLQNLPAYSYGLPVFNYGFDEAVVWLAPQIDTSRMQVLNRTMFFRQPIDVKEIATTATDTLIFSGQ